MTSAQREDRASDFMGQEALPRSGIANDLFRPATRVNM